jgi:hypothetical protein
VKPPPDQSIDNLERQMLHLYKSRPDGLIPAKWVSSHNKHEACADAVGAPEPARHASLSGQRGAVGGGYNTGGHLIWGLLRGADINSVPGGPPWSASSARGYGPPCSMENHAPSEDRSIELVTPSSGELGGLARVRKLMGVHMLYTHSRRNKLCPSCHSK